MQSFFFHIGGEQPKRDVALNGNQSLGPIQENKWFYSQMTVLQPGIEMRQTAPFLMNYFSKIKNLMTEYFLYILFFIFAIV